MRAHPLLMKGPLVRATLEGRKTQTRRPVKPWLGRNPPLWSRLLNQDGKPDFDWDELLYYGQDEDSLRHGFGFDDSGHGDTENDAWLASPMGQAGDRLWVRETFAIVHPCRDCESGYVDDIKQPSVIPKDNAGGYWVPWYRADWKGDDDTERGFQWTPSIHMPRWACRLVLPLVSVRVERVQDITEEDAEAEGVEQVGGSYREGFRAVWGSIYGTWDLNPWVWVAEWKKIEVRGKRSRCASENYQADDRGDGNPLRRDVRRREAEQTQLMNLMRERAQSNPMIFRLNRAIQEAWKEPLKVKPRSKRGQRTRRWR